MSDKSKNPLMAPEKPKKHHLWGLWIPLIVIFSLVVVPVGIVAVLFYDSHHVQTGIEGEPTDSNKLFSTIMTDMFDGCRKESKQTIDIKITQTDLNQLLYNAMYSTTHKEDSPLKQFSVQILDNNKYIFDLEISSFNILKTHLILEATVSGDNALGNGEKGFIFNITNMKVGRLSGLQGVLPWLTNTTNIDLSNIFSSAGLNMKFDIDNLRLTYSYQDFANDLSNLAKSSDPLFINIFSNFFTQEMVTFTHYEDSHINGTIPMDDFKENPAYTNSSANYVRRPDVDGIPFLTYVSNQVQSMIDNNIIANDENVTSNARTAIKFLAFGDDYLETAEKSYIDTIYSSIKANYCQNMELDDYADWAKAKSIGETKTDLVTDVGNEVNAILEVPGAKEQFLLDIQSDGEAYIFGHDNEPYPIEDSVVQSLLKNRKGLIGYGYSFVGQNSEGKSKVSYTVLDNVYPTFIPANTEDSESKDMMALTFGLNINGTETSLVMPMEGTTYHEDEIYGLSFNLKDAPLHFGTRDFPNIKDQLQGVINKVHSDSGDMIQFVRNGSGDIDKIEMKFNFNNYFTEHPESKFTEFHNLATGSPYNAELVVEFDFASSSTDAPSKRSGLINVSVGYVAPLAP